MQHIALSSALIFSLLLIGCASTKPLNLQAELADQSPAPNPISNAQTSPARAQRIQVTPLSRFTDLDTTAKIEATHFSNAYTRIIIQSALGDEAGAPGSGPIEQLPYQKRQAIWRYLWGKKFDLNLSAKIKIGDYETTASLLTISHQSNTDGEFWNRSISHKLLNFPLFLVRQDGTANIPEVSFNLAGSNEYSSNLAGAALQVALAGIQQLAPDAGVLTKLTAENSKDKARAIDRVLQNLFSNGIKEMHISHRDLRNWQDDGGAAIELWIPNQEGKWDDQNLGVVGRWRITFDTPRPSIFSDWAICPNAQARCKETRAQALSAAHQELNPGQVLNYRLTRDNPALGSIRAYLLQQDWYTNVLSEFNGEGNNDSKTADKLCKNIYQSITELGLNGDDADIVIHAFIHGLSLPPKIHSTAFQSGFCQAAQQRAKY